MTLNEAIIENEYICKGANDRITPGEKRAIKLGIEALKAVELCRKGVSANVYLLLPGETEESEKEG